MTYVVVVVNLVHTPILPYYLVCQNNILNVPRHSVIIIVWLVTTMPKKTVCSTTDTTTDTITDITHTAAKLWLPSNSMPVAGQLCATNCDRGNPIQGTMS